MCRPSRRVLRDNGTGPVSDGDAGDLRARARPKASCISYPVYAIFDVLLLERDELPMKYSPRPKAAAEAATTRPTRMGVQKELKRGR